MQTCRCVYLNNRFVLQPVSHIRKELDEKLHSNEEKIKSIEVSACETEIVFFLLIFNEFADLKIEKFQISQQFWVCPVSSLLGSSCEDRIGLSLQGFQDQEASEHEYKLTWLPKILTTFMYSVLNINTSSDTAQRKESGVEDD